MGGLSNHIQSLKEMVVFPLLYPEVFEKFKIQPPRWEELQKNIAQSLFFDEMNIGEGVYETEVDLFKKKKKATIIGILLPPPPIF